MTWSVKSAEVATTVAACRELGVGIVPLGGGTGLVGGAVGGPDVVALSLERMDRVLEVDADDRVLIAEAGVTLDPVGEAQQADPAFGILAEREVTDSATQEALLALPYAYGKLDIHGRAGDGVVAAVGDDGLLPVRIAVPDQWPL